MSQQMINYCLRRIARISGARDEVEYYPEPREVLPWPRPCFCEFSHLRDRLLGLPEREGVPCACAGPVGFNVPGYTGHWGQGDEHQMRRFCESIA